MLIHVMSRFVFEDYIVTCNCVHPLTVPHGHNHHIHGPSQNRPPVWTVLIVREPKMSFKLDAGYKLLSTIFTDKFFISYMLSNMPSQTF